jgi:small subunit ribosomal protein S6
MAKTAANMRSYFLTYLLPETLTETEVATHKKTITDLVTRHKGSVVKVEDWGKQRMAYKIRHGSKWHLEAYYVHFTLSLEPAQVIAFERDIYLQTQIMRHLLVVAETEGEAEEQAA